MSKGVSKQPGEKIQKILDEFPEKERLNILQRVAEVTIQETHSGPLPSPKVLTEYSTIIPNGAERIMQMAEKQQGHRIEMENTVIKSQMKQSLTGQIFALCIAVFGLTAATVVTLFGHDVVGTALGGTTVSALVGIFITGRRRQEKNLKEKNTK